MPKQIEILWSELEDLKNFEERIKIIHQDITENNKRYELLAKEDPYRLFKLLGGDETEIWTVDWALEYTYQEYIEENDFEYDTEEEKKWDLKGESIRRALDSGFWYVTGTSIIEGPNGIELEFEFEYCEGYLDGIIGTPYNIKEHGNHGFSFG